jgi:outer membrane cobalamin receptor
VKVIYDENKSDIPAFQRTDLNGVATKVGENYKTNPQIFIGGPGKTSLLVIIDGKKENPESMQDLKPEDIKGIKILKDQKAIEQYGEDASEGVIEITTKKKEEKE